jgi:hypothetical protein
MHSIEIAHFHCKPIGNADDPKNCGIVVMLDLSPGPVITS